MANLWMAGVVLDTRRLDELTGGMESRVNAVVDKIADKGVVMMQEQAAVDTGAMQASVYAVTQTHDDYTAASGRAKALNPKAETGPHPKPTLPTRANIGPCVHYSIYNELGTYKMAARPFVYPGAERIAEEFNAGENWKDLVK